jgi:hypothetical protein
VNQPTFAYIFVDNEDADAFQGRHTLFVALSTMGGGVESNDITNGLYEVNPSNGALTEVDNDVFSMGNGVTEHQSRLVSGHGDTVRFSGPGVTGWDSSTVPDPTAGYIRPNPSGALDVNDEKVYDGPWVVWMLSVPPGDFIIATRDGRIYNVQGDLADPAGLREMARIATAVSHGPVNTPFGVFFINPNVGVTKFGLDGGLEPVSLDILPSTWTLRHPRLGLGQLAYSGDYLFAPNQHDTEEHRNGALVYDFRTNAWFTSTHALDHRIRNPKFMEASADHRSAGIWVLSGESPNALANSADFAFNVLTGNSTDQDIGVPEQRNATWEWESAPFRDPEGGRVDIHQVRIPVYAWNDSSTMSVTVGERTHTIQLDEGRDVLVFSTRERDEFLTVRILSESNDPEVEAPMIESLSFGWSDGPRL